MRQLCFSQGVDTRIHVFVADACAFVTSLYPVCLTRHGYGRLCMGRDMAYRFGLSDMAIIVSGKGTDGTLVVAEKRILLYLQCVSFVSFG